MKKKQHVSNIIKMSLIISNLKFREVTFFLVDMICCMETASVAESCDRRSIQHLKTFEIAHECYIMLSREREKLLERF